MAFLKSRAVTPFAVGSSSLRHSGKTHMDFGLYRSLSTFIFSEKESVCGMQKAPWW